MPSNQISLKPTFVAQVLGAMSALLVSISIVLMLGFHFTGSRTIQLLFKAFDVNGERNVPAYFSTLLLIAAGVLIGIIALLKRNQKDPYMIHWTILSLGFLFMGADESYSYHERINEPMRNFLHNNNLGDYFYAWVIPAGIFVLIIGLFFLKFLLHLPMKTRVIFVVAAALYLGGAIGMEILEGRSATLYGWGNLGFLLFANLEEGLEMGSITLFIWELLRYINETYHGVHFDL